MMVSSMGAEIPEKGHMIPDRGGPGPMPQQGAGGSRGHEMHPQKLLQLVGYHDQNADRQEKGRLH